MTARHYNTKTLAPLMERDHITRAASIHMEEQDLKRQAASRKLDLEKYNATVTDNGAVPLMARYLGTRRKDGWHYMEVRIYGSAQVRRYVSPKYVEWRGEPPVIKWGDKMKDFM